jgi:hypothetical protein
MARPAYSKRFIGAIVGPAASVVATVPAGKLWIVNCITYVHVAFGLDGFLFVTAPGPLYLLDVNNQTAADGEKGTVITHQVMYAGEDLTVETTADPQWSVMISGFELNE